MQSRKNKGAWYLLYQNKLHYYDQHKHFFIVQRCANLGGRHIRGQTLLSAWKPSRLQFITMEKGFIIFRLCFWVILTHEVRSKQGDKLIYLTAWLWLWNRAKIFWITFLSCNESKLWFQPVMLKILGLVRLIMSRINLKVSWASVISTDIRFTYKRQTSEDNWDNFISIKQIYHKN